MAYARMIKGGAEEEGVIVGSGATITLGFGVVVAEVEQEVNKTASK
jgi:hypothetical protein